MYVYTACLSPYSYINTFTMKLEEVSHVPYGFDSLRKISVKLPRFGNERLEIGLGIPISNHAEEKKPLPGHIWV